MKNVPIVVVGASLAGLRAVEGCRRAGYAGPLTLVGAEEHLPYDRPPLSKAFLDAGHDRPAESTFRSEDEIHELDVDLRLGQLATRLDIEACAIVVGEESLPYSSLIIATGAHARALPGEALPGVHTLRTVDDARRIREALDAGARTVVVGGGFIGSEVASAARKRGVDVTIVEAADTPLVHAVGSEMAQVCARLHARHDTRLLCGVGVSALEGAGRVQRVVLSDNTSLEADLVVVGIGAAPATGWLEDSGLDLDDGIVCDETLRTSAPNVYAAGDVARWHNPLFERRMRLEHWTSAAEQGAFAARNALEPDSAKPFETVPYFWSDWYSQRLQMVGIGDADEVRLLGDPDADSWIALYRLDDRLVGALSLNRPGRIMKYRALISRRAAWDEALEFAHA
ncbi:NAD(P)/FAD-dependent oxidoreductase [Nocardioides sp.]|uniref:NAD(P)/FAD-dependent oxidoreductase n=1 Tax=Nocardioides sp. TaxID=35761 RepID=UPI002C7C29B1|nr:FAD-dependent oxidoreductase [Nocardioides sp.]HXH79762.1 FAD-dependent oxidoreductase [Nocardioides sp.]